MRSEMSQKGVRFGKALQMTNILRDVPKDLRLGPVLSAQGSAGASVAFRRRDLLDSGNSDAARARSLTWGISRALDHYNAAAEYLEAIPKRHYRLRLATAWPLLMGLGTLAELAKNKEWLNPDP